MIGRLTRKVLSRPTLARYFSEINSVKDNKPPLKEENVSGRYAGVLFTIASKNEALSKVNDDMVYITELINNSYEFNSFLRNSAAKRSEHQYVLEGIYPQVEDITVQFLCKC